jgi:tetratricopeptide (TPR) repeat protein
MSWSLPLAVIMVLGILASPARADRRADCTSQKDEDARIASCSEVIRVSPGDAVAYYHRGAAHQRKGDLERAISDYSKAIELKPDFAAAYHGRGTVNAAKGDYVKAVADVNRAGELAKVATSLREASAKMAAQRAKTSVGTKAQANQASSSNGLPKWAETHASRE